MERLRLWSSRLPRLLAAAVIVVCCAQLCLGLSSGTGSTLDTAVPCAHLGTAMREHCSTDPEGGAGTARAPMPEAMRQMQTEAELLPFPGTPVRTVEPPSPWGSPRGSWAGEEGTGPVVQDGAATEHPVAPLSAGTTEQAAAGSKRPPSASLGVTSVGTPAPTRADTASAAGSTTRTDPVGNVMAGSATTAQGTHLHSPPTTTVPSSAGGQWGSSTGLVQRQGSSRGSLSPEPRAREGLGAIVSLSGSSPGTRLSITPATASTVQGTIGTSPFVGGLQRLLSPMGTLRATQQGLPGTVGGRGSDSRPWHGTDVAWQGPRFVPDPSVPSLGAGGHGDTVASTAQPAVGTGPAPLPAAGEESRLPVPSAMAATPGVTSPSLGLSGAPNTEGPPDPHVRGDQTLQPPAVPGQPGTVVALGSTAVAQTAVPRASPGSPHVSSSPQPVPDSGSAAPTSPTLKTDWGVPGLGPTVGTPLAGPSMGHRLPHAGSGGDPAEPPQVMGGTPVGVSDAEPWTATAVLSQQLGSLAPPAAPRPPQQPPPSQSVAPLGLTTAMGIAVTAVTATMAATSPALRRDVGTVTPEPGAAVLQEDVAGLTRGPTAHLPTMAPESPQPPTEPPGTLGHRGGPGSPPATRDTDLVQPSSSPGGQPDTGTPQVTPTPAGAGRAPRVFIVEDQPPLLRASVLRIPCELVLDMGFVPALQDLGSPERRALLRSFNHTVSPLFTSVPGFLWLEVTRIREGSVVLEYDALFAAEQVPVLGLFALLNAALGSGPARRGLSVGDAPVLHNAALEWPLDPCAELFTCQAGFTCAAGAAGNATCTSLCHHNYCKNHGICTHPPDRGPLCQCPVGSDFWFMGLHCDYRVTQQSLLGMAAGVLLSIVLLGAVLAAVAIRRFKVLLLEARADQTRSSYRRFCRLDDVSAQYWSRSGPPSATSLDNPAFSTSEELLHLHIWGSSCSCREDSGVTHGPKQHLALSTRPDCRSSLHYAWDTSSGSVNDPMVDSGKASDISVSSWPMEPAPWTPFPLLHQLSRQPPHKARRPHSFCEGMELGSLERSWTA
ncbi:Interphotoreceptor matrix proteoglycan 2 [Columba livia]|nr:Interphotoreceptor matrix proteoglycan 2 [Columba livia]